MEARRQRTIVVGGLVAVVAMAIWWQFGRPSSVPEPVPAMGRAETSTSAASGPVAMVVPQVSIALLQRPRSEPVDTGRDLFKFAAPTRPADGGAGSGVAAVPHGSGASSLPGLTAPAGPAEAAVPPPHPPIPLRFVGVVQRQGDTTKIAVLSDGRGVYHGREGDIIEGRYRIVKVGNESVELVYLDGRGRQVLPLSGA